MIKNICNFFAIFFFEIKLLILMIFYHFLARYMSVLFMAMVHTVSIRNTRKAHKKQDSYENV
jgi:hypothetical protein